MSDGRVDPSTARRMRAAHRRARRSLSAQLTTTRAEQWGWSGRTLGRPVTVGDEPAWLRLAAVRTEQEDLTFWRGNVDAARILPP